MIPTGHETYIVIDAPACSLSAPNKIITWAYGTVREDTPQTGTGQGVPKAFGKAAQTQKLH